MPANNMAERTIGKSVFKDKEKPAEVRKSNIIAGKGLKDIKPQEMEGGCDELCALSAAVADAIRTSLGPKGMDKMVRLCLVHSALFHQATPPTDPGVEWRRHDNQ